MGRGFTWRLVTIASLCNSGLEWIYQGVCRYIQGNLVGNAQLFAKSGNIIFLDFERDVVAPCFSWFPCLLWHSHMFELLSWFRSAQLEAFLWIDLPPPCLPLLVKPHLHLLQYLKARDSDVLFIFRYIFVAILTNIFDCQYWAVNKKVDIVAKNDKN